MDTQAGPGAANAEWYADPMGRHQFRFWDGMMWTDAVSDNGVQATDPLAQATQMQVAQVAPVQMGQAPPAKVNKIRQRLLERSQPLLPPGTQIRQIFGAETQSPVLMICLMILLALLPGAIVFMLINRNRIIAVGQDAIYVLDCGMFGWASPNRLLRTLPRATRLGPASGTWPRVNSCQERLYTSNRAGWFAEINAADAEAPLQAAPAMALPAAPARALPAVPATALPAAAATSVAVFRPDAPSAGAAIVCDGSRLLFGSPEGQPLEWDLVCSYDRSGYLEWASEDWRQWVWQHAPAAGNA